MAGQLLLEASEFSWSDQMLDCWLAEFHSSHSVARIAACLEFLVHHQLPLLSHCGVCALVCQRACCVSEMMI